MTIPAMLRRHARQRPQKLALIDRDREFSYRQLDRMVDHGCHALAKAGFGHGDLIGLALEDRAEHLVMILALGRIGATLLPLDPRWAAHEIEGVANNFGAKAILSDTIADRAGWVRVTDDWYGESDRPYEDDRVDADTPMLLSLSSGTTGMPKGPRVSHGKFIARFTLFWLDFGLSSRDRFVTATPIYFGGGRAFALAMIYAGGTAVLFCPPFKSQELIDYVARVKGTAAFLVPTMLRRLLTEKHERIAFPTLRALISSGSAIYASEQAQVREQLSPNLFQYYSSTEGGGCTVLGPDAFLAHPDSVGQPCFGVDVEVVDAEHRPLPAGEIGRLRYRSAASADSYYKGDGSAAFHDGWFYPGDLGTFDADGFLYLRGRSKDMIIRGGVNIYPNDIEAVLLEIEGVREAAVVGAPSTEFGEEVAAFLVAPGLDEDNVRAVCAEKLARYKRPKLIRFVDDLPKTGVGKVDKARLVQSLDQA